MSRCIWLVCRGVTIGVVTGRRTRVELCTCLSSGWCFFSRHITPSSFVHIFNRYSEVLASHATKAILPRIDFGMFLLLLYNTSVWRLLVGNAQRDAIGDCNQGGTSVGRGIPCPAWRSRRWGRVAREAHCRRRASSSGGAGENDGPKVCVAQQCCLKLEKAGWERYRGTHWMSQFGSGTIFSHTVARIQRCLRRQGG